MGLFSLFKNKKTKTQEPLKQKSYGGYGYGSQHFPTFYFNDATASFLDLSNDYALLKCYQENPIVNTVINVRANAMSNMRFFEEDIATGEIVPIEQSSDAELKKALLQPNPWQTTKEWIKSYSINYDVFGDAYMYASVPVGFEDRFTYADVRANNILSSYLVKPKVTGNFLEATVISEIIKYYEFKNQLSNKTQKINTSQVLHINNSNIELNQYFTTGQSKLLALHQPVSNIKGAFESRNVLIKKRGALGMISSDKRDDAGTVPLMPKEVEETQDAYRKYGLMEDQNHLLILDQPLKYTQMAMKVRDLMLFEEIESDTIIIAHAYGVPELLVKAHIQGGTFENLNASERRLYDSTIIPESQILVDGLNTFYKTAERGKRIIGSFEHVKALQTDKKQEAETNAINERAALSAFNVGAITYNAYLNAMGMPNDEKIGEKKIWDLDPKQIRIIKSQLNNIGDEDGQGNTNTGA